MEMNKGNVQVVVINQSGQFLCVSRKDDHTSFGLAGGKMESTDASPEDAAIRETFEETGLNVFNLELIHEGLWHEEYQRTYVAEFEEAEFNYSEPHVVKWGTAQDLIDGKFGEYNTIILKKLGKI